MPSAFIHYFFGVILADFFGYAGKDKLVYALISVIPDIDFVSIFLVRHVFVLTRNHPLLGRAIFHRGITHTFLFSFSALILFLFLGMRELALFLFLSLLLHIFWDYVSIWGVSPLFPFSQKGHAANLLSINDVPMTLLMLFASVASFHSSALLSLFLSFCLLYVIARLVLKIYLKRKTGAPLSSIIPTCSLHYAHARKEEGRYVVGKFSLLTQKSETRIIDSNEVGKEYLLPKGLGKDFIEFPVFVSEGGGTRIFDARSILFGQGTPFSMAFFVKEGAIFLESGMGRIELPPSWVLW